MRTLPSETIISDNIGWHEIWRKFYNLTTTMIPKGNGPSHYSNMAALIKGFLAIYRHYNQCYHMIQNCNYYNADTSIVKHCPNFLNFLMIDVMQFQSPNFT
jgi:hypothetical protein